MQDFLFESQTTRDALILLYCARGREVFNTGKFSHKEELEQESRSWKQNSHGTNDQEKFLLYLQPNRKFDLEFYHMQEKWRGWKFRLSEREARTGS